MKLLSTEMKLTTNEQVYGVTGTLCSIVKCFRERQYDQMAVCTTWKLNIDIFGCHVTKVTDVGD